MSIAGFVSTYRSLSGWSEVGKLFWICGDPQDQDWADRPDTLTNMANLTLTYWEQNSFDETETLEV